jgi:NAD(P)-dependent dehydrogenase (short-subunit alcohol dehydrogenase family)
MATAIVTGGSRGLGQVLVRTLHDLGWNVVTDGRDAAQLAASVRGVDPDRVTAIAGDVTDPAHRSDLVAAAREYGHLVALVNNASSIGPSPMPKLIDYPLDAWRAVYEVDVVAPLALIQLVLPLLGDGGRIIDITSDAAVEGYEGWGAYGSAKAALEQLTNVLAAEHTNLSVHRVDPGDMRTQMHQDAFPGEDISDRPLPDASVPGLVALLLGDYPSGRYVAREITEHPGAQAPAEPAEATS